MSRFFSRNILGNTPPVTKNLIIINVVMWVGTLLFIQLFKVNLIGLLGLFPTPSPLFKPWQIVTHMFMHSHVRMFHIIFNMWALWMFGKVLEGVWGGKRFLIYYLITGMGAMLVHSLVNYIQLAPEIAALKAAYSVDHINMALLNQISQPGNQFYRLARDLAVPTIGASGAVYGVLLAFGVLFPNTPLIIFPLPIPIKAKWLIIAAAVISLFLGLTGKGGNVAHFAHLGGMIFGFIMIKYWNKFTGNFY
jgi:membrane associated rhomboid family serine protease